MNELDKTAKTEKKLDDQHLIDERVDDPEMELPAQAGLREKVRRLLSNVQRPGARTRQDPAKDRTRSLALVIGGTVGAVLLFIAMFSTPTTPPTQPASGRPTPNLGRAAAPNQPSGPQGSVTPLLNADIRSGESDSGQLSPADIQGTSRRAPPGEISSPETRRDAGAPRAPIRPPRNLDATGLPTSTGSDPLAAYRLNNSTGAPTYSYGGRPPSAVGVEPAPTYTFGATKPAGSRLDTSMSVKSSIVFVRSPDAAAAGGISGRIPPLGESSLLPPGTRLLARFESAATTAVKTPVVASIEYNYEFDGMIIVPAGTRAFGDVQQASPEGYLNVRFHTLRLPTGREEGIEATGVALDHKPLKGQVSGKNTGKKFLSRTLSGVGTIAAYVVGAGGAGLSRTVTGETLLRDRVASNIALAGEQELMNNAYSQNISVTVPANTRFYVVLQKAAVAAPSQTAASSAASVQMPTAQELRELMDLRQEINRIYQESNGISSAVTKP